MHYLFLCDISLRYADVVAHRQLLAALNLSQQMQQQGLQASSQPLPPPIPHSGEWGIAMMLLLPL